MSSDTYTVTVQSIDGNKLTLRARTSLASGLTNASWTRSFVLMFLYERSYEVGSTPLSEAARGLGEAGVEIWDEEFHKRHVGSFIESVTLASRRNPPAEERADGDLGVDFDEDAPSLAAFAREVAEMPDLSELQREDELCKRYHSFVVDSVVTDPKWLAGLEVGMVAGTTAYDIWYEG